MNYHLQQYNIIILSLTICNVVNSSLSSESPQASNEPYTSLEVRRCHTHNIQQGIQKYWTMSPTTFRVSRNKTRYTISKKQRLLTCHYNQKDLSDYVSNLDPCNHYKLNFKGYSQTIALIQLEPLNKVELFEIMKDLSAKEVYLALALSRVQ